MSIKKYLSPIDPDALGFIPSQRTLLLGAVAKVYVPGGNLPSVPKNGIVILGVGEDRGAEDNAGCAAAPNEIRAQLYQLAVPAKNVKITDYGNLVLGQTQEDTYYALAQVSAAVLAKNATLIVLGGSQDLTFALYKAYEILNKVMNLTTIDPRFDLENNDTTTSRTWLRDIVMQSTNVLYFHSNIGYQTYFVGQSYVDLMDELKFEAYRLGEVRQDMNIAETALRDADLVSVDLSAIRQSDAPALGKPSAHGFYGEEFCQLMQYAGMSDRTHCLGIFELNPLYDNRNQTTQMVAQGLWYFIDSFLHRKHDNPQLYPESCRHYYVHLEEQDLDLDFYESKLTGRWWMKVPCHNEKQRKIYGDSQFFPCTRDDYQQAMQNEIPNRWWHFFKRMN